MQKYCYYHQVILITGQMRQCRHLKVLRLRPSSFICSAALVQAETRFFHLQPLVKGHSEDFHNFAGTSLAPLFSSHLSFVGFCVSSGVSQCSSSWFMLYLWQKVYFFFFLRRAQCVFIQPVSPPALQKTAQSKCEILQKNNLEKVAVTWATAA